MVDEREKYWDEINKKWRELEEESKKSFMGLLKRIKDLEGEEREILSKLFKIRVEKVRANIKLMRTPEMKIMYQEAMLKAWREILKKHPEIAVELSEALKGVWEKVRKMKEQL